MNTAVKFPIKTDSEDVFAQPQPGPQTALVKCPIEDIFYGGARGGGKSHGLFLKFLHQQEIYRAHSKAIFFRKTYKELENLIEKGKSILLPLGADWLEGKTMFIMPSGATLKMRHLGRDADADDYQGHEYTLAGFDELPNWARPEPIDKIRACLRSPEGVPCQMIATGNPGGVGHNWVKARYIDPSPPYKTHISGNVKRVFIPSLLKDNPKLLEADPGYIDRLKTSGPEWLVRAWLNGDWNIVAGGMFDDIWGMNQNNIIVEPFVIPSSWRVDRSFDAGWAHPFSVGWWAESDGTGSRIPRGSLVRVAEWYGAKKPNEGVNMLPADIAKGIAHREAALKSGVLKGHKIYPGPADTEIWSGDKGVRVIDIFTENGVSFDQADKSPGTRVTGWQRIREYLSNAGGELPGLYIFNTCREWIRTVPGLPRDDKKIDDVDTQAEDHIADETRYRLLHVKKAYKVGKLTGL